MKYCLTFFFVVLINLFTFYSFAQKDACSGLTTISYGGQSYPIVAIGTQCWMQQNLNIGTKISSSTSPNQTDNGIIEKYCYQDDDANCTTYGGLYQWAEMVRYFRGATNTTPMNPVLGSSSLQGICPPGWHIPSSSEWITLFKIYDPSFSQTNNVSSLVGGKLKEAGLLHWNSPNTGADNTSGFTAYGGGIFSGSYSTFKTYGYFASVDDVNYSSKYIYFTNNTSNGVLDTDIKSYALSVRCLKGNGIDMGSGIENNKLDINEVLDVFPNPANQVLNFNFKKNQPEDAHVFIVNSLGESVFSTMILKDNFATDNAIKVDKLPEGNYFFKIEFNNKVYSKKIIIARK